MHFYYFMIKLPAETIENEIMQSTERGNRWIRGNEIPLTILNIESISRKFASEYGTAKWFFISFLSHHFRVLRSQ